MKSRILILSALFSAFMAAQADLNETFSYPDGPLTTSSGGVWTLWNPASSSDATVASGVAVLGVGSDVERTFTGALTADGSANFSFDFTLTTLATDANVFFSPTSLPFSTGQNYDQSLGFDFNDNGAGRIVVYGGTSVVVVAQTVSAGLHHVTGTLTRTGSSMAYTSFLDGNSIRAGAFTFNDARGINGTEIYQNTASGNGNGSIDNLVLSTVPEPATLGIIGIGLLSLLARRRK